MQFVIFPNRTEFEIFREACRSTYVYADNGTESLVNHEPSICYGTDPCGLSEPAAESTLDEDGTAYPDSAWYYCHPFTEEQLAFMLLCALEVRIGGLDGPLYGEEDDA